MKSKKKLSRKKTSIRKGAIGSGMMFVMILILMVGGIAFTLVGGQLPQLNDNNVGSPVVVNAPNPSGAQDNLQLITFWGATITPTPVSSSGPVGCAQSEFNTEDEILIGSDPAPGNAVSTTNKIRVWVIDEATPVISRGEVVDSGTGLITTVGDRNEKDTDADGEGNYLWEPTLYVVPASGTPPTAPFCDVNNISCAPRFPNYIKGKYDNMNDVLNGPQIDADWVDFQNGPGSTDFPIPISDVINFWDTAEYIWDVSTFGLTSGSYWAQFVIHDGDGNLAISCVTIQIP